MAVAKTLVPVTASVSAAAFWTVTRTRRGGPTRAVAVWHSIRSRLSRSHARPSPASLASAQDSETAAESWGMTTPRRCRICGAIWPYPGHYWITEGGGCKTCGGSPLCDSCGHARSKHVAVFKKGKRQCTFRAFDLQSLSRLRCECRGYVPVGGSLSDAAFAQPDTEPFPPLRLADGNR